MGDLNVYIPDAPKKYKTELLNYMCKEKDLNDNLIEIQKHNYFKNNLEENEIKYLLQIELIKDNKLKLFLINNIEYNKIIK